jgi:hypothetical protein
LVVTRNRGPPTSPHHCTVPPPSSSDAFNDSESIGKRLSTHEGSSHQTNRPLRMRRRVGWGGGQGQPPPLPRLVPHSAVVVDVAVGRGQRGLHTRNSRLSSRFLGTNGEKRHPPKQPSPPDVATACVVWCAWSLADTHHTHTHTHHAHTRASLRANPNAYVASMASGGELLDGAGPAAGAMEQDDFETQEEWPTEGVDREYDLKEALPLNRKCLDNSNASCFAQPHLCTNQALVPHPHTHTLKTLTIGFNVCIVAVPQRCRVRRGGRARLFGAGLQ